MKRMIHLLRHLFGFVRCEVDTQITEMNGANYFTHITRCVECGRIVSTFVGRNIGRQQIVHSERDWMFRKHWTVGVREYCNPVLAAEVPMAAKKAIMNGAKLVNESGEEVSPGQLHNQPCFYSGERYEQ